MDEHLERQYLEVELYEKIVVRERRRKAVLITLAFCIFSFLCAMPVYSERKPKWESLSAAKNIAIEIEKLKTESLHLMKPLQLTVLDNGQLKVERVLACNVSKGEVRKVEELLHEENWINSNNEIALLDANWAGRQICFDPVSGMNSPQVKKVFVLVPVKDLAESRLDRASYIEVETAFAKISIN